VLVAASIATGFGVMYLVPLGLSLVFGGVAGLLTPKITPTPPTEQARPEDRPSFLFNGVTNVANQGVPVPVVLGTHLVGSVLVAGSINAQDITP
jgi:predicted phage tail protein